MRRVGCRPGWRKSGERRVRVRIIKVFTARNIRSFGREAIETVEVESFDAPVKTSPDRGAE